MCRARGLLSPRTSAEASSGHGGKRTRHLQPDLAVRLLLLCSDIRPEQLTEENTSRIIFKSDFFSPSSRQAA